MNMTDAELRELIREIITEERAEALAHPSKRERVTKFTDSSGQTWISTTLKQGEIVQKIAALVIALTTLFGAVNYFVTRLVVYPAIEERLVIYQKEATARMEAQRPQVVTRVEYDRWTADKEARWRSQAELNAAVSDSLREIRADIKELLRRR